MDQLSSLTIGAYILSLLFGGVGCLLAAWAVQFIVRRCAAKRVGSRVAFWATLVGLTGWLAWWLFVPTVNFEIVSVSPDGRLRLRIQDITSEMLYDDLGWRMRARLEDVRTGRRLAQRMLRHWDSSFGQLESVMPTPADVSVTWRADSRSVEVKLPGSTWVSPP